MQRELDIDGVRLHLSQPQEFESQWIGQDEILKQLLACWLVVGEKDLPHNRITAEDVQRVAATYLIESARTVAYTHAPAEGGPK